MFTAALYIIAKVWKQPKCPSMNEWIKKMSHTHTQEYRSATKKKETLLFMTTWMDLEDIMLSEISQIQKDKYHIISNICGIFKKKPRNPNSYIQQTDWWWPETGGQAWKKMGEGGQKVQTLSNKINKRDVMYNMRNLANTAAQDMGKLLKEYQEGLPWWRSG